MTLFFGPIRQIAFVTRDLHASIDFYHRYLGVGPWFLADRATHRHRYRGGECEFVMSVAMADADGLQIELLQQHDDVPTLYSESMARPFVRELQHHLTMWPTAYNRTLAQAEAAGYRPVQDGATSRGRFVYLEHPGNPDQIIEFTEATPARQAFNGAIARAAVNWDGTNPIRAFDAAC